LEEALNKKVKFRIFFLLGIGIFLPFFTLSIIARLYVYAVLILGGFLMYCYFLYHLILKGETAEYPMVPPEGRMDVYFPRTNIPRPIYEDMQRYPEFLKRKKRKYERRKALKKKS